MGALPYPHFRELLTDGEAQVQAQAFNLLRNLVHGQPEDISAVLEYSGQHVLRVLESKLATTASGQLGGGRLLRLRLRVDLTRTVH